MNRQSSSNSIIDLVVLFHGINFERWAHNQENKHMHFIAEKIREAKQFQFSRIICSVVNTGKTLDGIETCGLRAAKEIVEVMRQYNKKTLFRLYIIGHSLGGLIGRNCIKHLYDNKKIWERIIPVSFITLSTPHLGVQRTLLLTNFFVKICGNHFLKGLSMKELLLRDHLTRSTDNRNLPLLWKMSVIDSNYMEALKSFPFKTLISNIKRDFTVPYTTSAISYWNPYKKLKRFHKYRIAGYSGFNLSQSQQIFEETTKVEYEPMNPLQTKKLPSDLILMGNKYMSDNEKKIKFVPGMVQNLNQLDWRRVDIELSSIAFNHEYIIRRASFPFGHSHHGTFVISHLVRILISDYQQISTI